MYVFVVEWTGPVEDTREEKIRKVIRRLDRE